MWFYKFEQDAKTKKIHIIWNTMATYIKNSLGTVGVCACFLNYFWIAGFCLISLAVYLGYYLNRHGDLIHVLRLSEKDQVLEYTGSRYSFKHPLKVVIPIDRLK